MYHNRFDRDGGEDVFVKRSVILKNSFSYYPEYENDGTKKYILVFDPASKLDNSCLLYTSCQSKHRAENSMEWMREKRAEISNVDKIP